MSTMTLKALLFGEDVSMGKAFKGAGKAAEETGGKLQGLSGMAKAALTAGAVVAVAAFAKSSVDAFKNVGGEVLKMQRIMGGTPEEVSRLRFAFQQSGIDADSAAKGIGKMEKTLVAAEGSTKATAAMTKTLGFAFRDAHGHILPMSQLIPKLADKFAAMKAGPEKTALAMKLFGKAGADLLPFLNKGSKGLGDLAKESDKFGLTLTGKNLTALKDAKKNQREWDASIEGVKVQFGAQLLPILTKFTTFLTSQVIPWITKLTGFLKEHKQVVGLVATVIGTLVAAITIWNAVQKVLNAELFANPIGLVVIALVALAAGLIWAYKNVGWFRAACDIAFHAIGAAGIWLWNNALEPAIQFILRGFASVAGSIGHVLQALGRIPGFGWAKTAGDMMVSAANGARALADNIHAIPSSKTVGIHFAMTAGGAPVNRGRINVPGVGPVNAGMYAKGGSNLPAGWKVVGEHGPELMWTPGGDTVLTARETASALSGRRGGSAGSSGGSSERPLLVQLMVDGRVLQQSLLKVKQTNGGVNLGLA